MASTYPPPRDRDDFDVAVICALSLEAEFVYDVLDKIWDDKKYGKASGDDNGYTLGVIGEHNVVLVHMPGMGTLRAAHATGDLKRSFPNIQLNLVVGVCGGMPFGAHKEEIVLGDVVISKALIQYDFGKQYPQGFKRKTDVLDVLRAPSDKILALLAKIEIRQHMRNMRDNAATFLQAIQQKSLTAKHPGVENDILYHSSYVHRHHSPMTCVECEKGDETCDAAVRMGCEELGCESDMRVARERLMDPASIQPMIHLGIMGSGNSVIKSGHYRDALAQEEGIVAVEMEGAGVWRDGSSIVIKGVCDYADSHKRKGWQRYAAATAAACTKALLVEWVPEQKVIPTHIVALPPKTPREPEGIQAYGLCWGAAPLIDVDLFIGRAAELDQMAQALQPGEVAVEQRRVVLGGLGGIGKTQVAIAYARQHQSRYASVFWLDATSASTLKASFQSIAQQLLTAIELQSLNEEGTLQAVLRWLSDVMNTQWLLIFDNHDDPELYSIEQYLPNTGHGSIIITTRLPDLIKGQRMRQIRISPISNLDESLKILQTRSQRDNVQHDLDARRLVERLAGFPLALATAGAYLSKTTATFGEYLDAYEQRFNVNPRRPTRLQEYQDRTLYTTWDLSYSRLERDDKLAALTLRLLAYFDNQQIWYELLHAGLDADSPDWLQDLLVQHIDFDNVMGTLVDYCLMEAHPAARSYSMHNCVHDWTSVELKNVINLQLYWYVFESVAACIGEHDWEVLWQVRYHRLALHAIRLVRIGLRHTTIFHSTDTRRLDQAVWIAQLMAQQSHWAPAVWMYKQVLTEDEKTLGPDHVSTLGVAANLGFLYSQQSSYENAEVLLEKAMIGYERMLGSDHTFTLASIDSLGVLYAEQGNDERAKELLERALNGHKRVQGLGHPSTLTSMNLVARLYLRQGKLDEAEVTLSQVLSGLEKLARPIESLTLYTYQNLGRLYEEQNRSTEAEKMYTKALSGYEKLAGRDNVLVLDAVHHLGVIYARQGKLEKAEQKYLRALAGKERALGLNHTSTLTTISGLGNLYHDQGKLTQAEEKLSQVLSMYQGSDTKLRWSETIHNLTAVFAKNTKSDCEDLQAAKGRLAHLIQHIARWNRWDGDLYWLARALLWVEDYENSRITFSQGTRARCDNCKCQITSTRGHFVCCQCYDTDLCGDCMARRADKGLNLPECEGHEFYEVTAVVIDSSTTTKVETPIDTAMWVESLRKKYLMVDES